MKILLTGATGFIGSHLLERLIDEKHQLFILTRSTSDPWRIQHLLNQVQQVDELHLEKLFQTSSLDLIFHVSTYYVKTHHAKDIPELLHSNIELPSKLLEYCEQYKVKYFINIGTCFEYQPTPKKIKETEPTHPYNFYAATKVAFEQILKYYEQSQVLRAVTLKLFYPYGEKDNQKVIPLMINSLLKNEKIVISKGEQTLDFTYVGDIVNACIKSLEFITSEKYKGYEVFNIGEGKGKQLRTVAQYLNTLNKKKLIFCKKEYGNNEIMYMIANTTKANKILNWYPETNINEGLKKVYEYYKKN